MSKTAPVGPVTTGSQGNGVDKAEPAVLEGRTEAQVLAELLGQLRQRGFSWWTPAELRQVWPARVRLGWIADCVGIRQRVTHALTGLAPGAARSMGPELQATLIDAVLAAQDQTVEKFEYALAPDEIAAWGPGREIWHEFRRRFPLDDDPAHKLLLACLIERMLADRRLDGTPREPLITPLQLRRTISAWAWHTHLPMEVKVRVDEARFEHEARVPPATFGAREELEVVTVAALVDHLPMTELDGVLDLAEQRMGGADGVVGLAVKVSLGGAEEALEALDADDVLDEFSEDEEDVLSSRTDPGLVRVMGEEDGEESPVPD